MLRGLFRVLRRLLIAILEEKAVDGMGYASKPSPNTPPGGDWHGKSFRVMCPIQWFRRYARLAMGFLCSAARLAMGFLLRLITNVHFTCSLHSRKACSPP